MANPNLPGFTETRLRGWACKTRTQKRRRNISLWKVAQIPRIQPNSGHRDHSRLSCAVGIRSSGQLAKQKTNWVANSVAARVIDRPFHVAREARCPDGRSEERRVGKECR